MYPTSIKPWRNKNMIITAYSSWGYFTFDAITGVVISHELDNGFGSYPCKVDVYEYFDYYGESLPQIVDILDIGFYDLTGIYVSPEIEWRHDRHNINNTLEKQNEQ